VDLLRLFIANRTPVTLWGPVGARKTRTIEALSRETDENGVPYQVITLQPSTQDPTIIHGMMYTSREDNKTVMRRSVPRVADQVIEYANETGGLTILFADEMTTCMPSQQNAMLGLLTHGRFEDLDISPHISIVMAANPEGTVSSVIPLNEAVMNRGGHIAWFGDQRLFLEEWASGFGGATQAPRESTVRLMRSMFSQSPDKVFRSPDRWDTDSLVPWDMMEHTERAVTEAGKMVELISDVFEQAPPPVVARYTIEATRALLGPQWADIASAVIDQRSDGASKLGVLSWVRTVTPKALLGADGIDSIVEQHGPAWSEDLRHDQAGEVLRDLTEGALRDGTFSSDHYLGGWAFISCAPSEADLAGLSEQIASLVIVGRTAIQEELITKSAAIPGFVPEYVRNLARDATRDYLNSQSQNQ
jgi:hypothetical protein